MMVELGPLMLEYSRMFLWSIIVLAVVIHIFVPLPRLGMLNSSAIGSYCTMYIFNIFLKLVLFIYICTFSLPILGLFVLVRISLLKYFQIDLPVPLDIQFSISILFVFVYASYSSRKLDKELGVEGLEEGNHCRELLRKHSVNVEDHLLKKIQFLVSANPDLIGNAITYGGLFAKPRIVLPINYKYSFSEPMLVGILSHEIGHILRRDIGFKSLVYTLNLMFLKFSDWLKKTTQRLMRILAQTKLLAILILPLIFLLYMIKFVVLLYRLILHFLSCSESYVAEFLTDTVAVSLVPSAYLNIAFHGLAGGSTGARMGRETILREGVAIAKTTRNQSIDDGFWVQILESFAQGTTHTHPPLKKRILWVSSIDHHTEIYEHELSRELKALNSFKFGKLYLLIFLFASFYWVQNQVTEIYDYRERLQEEKDVRS